MDDENLQVTQTNAACLCNLTDNAASAEIKGVEAEFQFGRDSLRLSLPGRTSTRRTRTSSSWRCNPITGAASRQLGKHACSARRDAQVSAGGRLDVAVGKCGEALNFHVNYSWQSDMFWATDNIAKETVVWPARCAHRAGAAGSPWSVALYGKNVTDELYRVNIISFFGEQVSQFGAPRTYGLDFSYKF